MRASVPTGVSPPHILVVDDEPQIRDLLRTVLEREGYRVTVQAEARHALATVRSEAVSILITDLKMPRMNGLELLQAAKTYRPDLGSILITGYASTETAVEALRFGADDFITKPFSLEDLRRVVDRVLSERRLIAQERDALDLAREEAETLRQRSRNAEAALATAQQDLQTSRRKLENRVHDLEFLRQLTALLAKSDGLQRMLETTARILTARFQARVTRLEVVLAGDVHTALYAPEIADARLLAGLGADLVERARRRHEPALSEVRMAPDRATELMAAPLDLLTGPAGSIVLWRDVRAGEDPRDLSVFAQVPGALGIAVDAEVQRRAAVDSALDVATRILEALEGRGTLFKGHAERVAELASTMAEHMGLSPRLQAVIRTAARLHDVGEVGVPDDVLRRDGPLSDGEREILRQHPMIGARILAPLGEAAVFVRHHKERPDGSGYPDGLRDAEIPLGAAIIGVAEAFDAMTHHRAWRATRSRAAARAEIERLQGVQFKTEAVEALLRLPARRPCG